MRGWVVIPVANFGVPVIAGDTDLAWPTDACECGLEMPLTTVPIVECILWMVDDVGLTAGGDVLAP